MATFTLLVSVENRDAPTLARDLADQIKAALETGGPAWPSYAVAVIDGVRGDRLDYSKDARLARADHRHVAAGFYEPSARRPAA